MSVFLRIVNTILAACVLSLALLALAIINAGQSLIVGVSILLLLWGCWIVAVGLVIHFCEQEDRTDGVAHDYKNNLIGHTPSASSSDGA